MGGGLGGTWGGGGLREGRLGGGGSRWGALGWGGGIQVGRGEPILGHFGPSEVQKALKVGLVVMGFTCKLISLCQEPSMCESFLMPLTSHS